MDHPKVAFFFPSHEVGGTQVLFLRSAEMLVAAGGEAAVVDSPEGYMAQAAASLAGGRIRRVEVDYRRRRPLAGFTHVVATPVGLVQLAQLFDLDPTCRLLVWCTHPNDFAACLPASRLVQRDGRQAMAGKIRRYWPIGRAYLSRLYHLCHERRGIVFCDGDYRSFNDVLWGAPAGAEDTTVPLPVSGAISAARPPRRTADGTVAVAWIGRCVDFKRPILDHLAACANRTCRAHPDSRVELHMIGVPKDMADTFAGLAGRPDNFTPVWPGTVPHAELAAYLQSRVDAVFAMGTSSLEGAAAGLPTVDLDYSFNQVPEEYGFRWLFDNPPGDLGRNISDPDWAHPGPRHTFGEVLDELRRRPGELGERCLAHVRAHHAPDRVAARLRAALDDTRLAVADVTALRMPVGMRAWHATKHLLLKRV